MALLFLFVRLSLDLPSIDYFYRGFFHKKVAAAVGATRRRPARPQGGEGRGISVFRIIASSPKLDQIPETPPCRLKRAIRLLPQRSHLVAGAHPFSFLSFRDSGLQFARLAIPFRGVCRRRSCLAPYRAARIIEFRLFDRAICVLLRPRNGTPNRTCSLSPADARRRGATRHEQSAHERERQLR